MPNLVEGGTIAWTAAGLPVGCGRRMIPLDGQVRIAIGSIVLTSALLSLLNPYFWTSRSLWVSD